MKHRTQFDHYALLGINTTASNAELRRAWKRLAQQWHPDRAGEDATETFQALQAAYAVLSDPITRAKYDRRLQRASSARGTGTRGRRAPAIMLRRVSGHLNGLLACGIARRDGDIIELSLNADEAESGGMITVSMRVAVRCPVCSSTPPQQCDVCGSTRVVDDLFSAWLAVPPSVQDGARLVPSAILPGMIHPVSFRVRTGLR